MLTFMLGLGMGIGLVVCGGGGCCLWWGLLLEEVRFGGGGLGLGWGDAISMLFLVVRAALDD
jgi:hypothetical protein